MNTHELTTDGNVFRLHTRPSVTPAAAAPARRDLTQAQLAWCHTYLKAFAWPRAALLKETTDGR